MEAVNYWDKTLKCAPTFGMALANKGYGLISYAQTMYDEGHTRLFLKYAYEFLRQGLETHEIHQGAKKTFEQAMNKVESQVGKEFIEESFEMNDYSLGNSENEREYRRYCLNNKLYLNPLNDLGLFNIAARDVMTCPSILTFKEEMSTYPPVFFGFYNQLKQEYVSARFLFYESIQRQILHYSDKDVQMYNTLDYPCYGLYTEKIKIAYRISYSIFDKIAFFINEYLKLRVPETKISFKTIWYKKQKKENGLCDEFLNLENWPLRGLFWLAKDFSENRPKFRNSIEPEAQDLVNIRNHLEHKYLTITEYEMLDIEDLSTGSQRRVYRIIKDIFIIKTLKIMNLTREALIYLSLGIHIEERKKTSKVNGVIAPISLDIWEDDWKI